jgi:hypothetical protein
VEKFLLAGGVCCLSQFTSLTRVLASFIAKMATLALCVAELLFVGVTDLTSWLNTNFIVKVKNQPDMTKYAVFIASTCFGHQYAHHQEYNY